MVGGQEDMIEDTAMTMAALILSGGVTEAVAVKPAATMSTLRVQGLGPSAANSFKENSMPFAQIYLLEGRTDEQKKAVIAKVTQALHEAVGAPKENIRVWIHDVPKGNWGIAGQTAADLDR
jgi:4-oxalocrotonate tautomerase